MPGDGTGPCQASLSAVRRSNTGHGPPGPASSRGGSCVVSFLLVPLFGPKFSQEESHWDLGRMKGPEGFTGQRMAGVGTRGKFGRYRQVLREKGETACNAVAQGTCSRIQHLEIHFGSDFMKAGSSSI